MPVTKLPFEEFRSIYSKVPRLCVEVVARTSQGVILTKRNNPPLEGFWHIPGGTVLLGETLEIAVKRIALEELELNVEVQEMLGVIEYSFLNYFSQPIGIAYSVKILDCDLAKLVDSDKFCIFNIIPENTFEDQKRFLVKNFNFQVK